MNEFIQSNGGFVAATVVIMLSTLAFLTGLKSALELIVLKTENKTDDKLLSIVSTVCDVLSKILGLVTANKPAKIEEKSDSK